MSEAETVEIENPHLQGNNKPIYDEITASDLEVVGEIPADISALVDLEYFNLYNNQLSGNIYTQFDPLTKLESIFLHHNNFNGEIPESIFNLPNLNRLYLKNNQFNGTINENVCNSNIVWDNSLYFNINDNQICPPYPSCIQEHVGEQDTTDCD